MKWVEFKIQKPEIGTEIIIYYPMYGSSKHFMMICPYIHEDQIEGATHWVEKPKPPKESRTGFCCDICSKPANIHSIRLPKPVRRCFECATEEDNK